MTIIDLTHKLSSDIPSWDENFSFGLSIDTDYKNCAPPFLFRTQKIICNTSMGTHMDAPAHVIPGARTIDQLTIEELVVDCVVVDVSKDSNADYVITSEVLEKFEKQYGKIKAKSFVIFYTGWDQNWKNKEKYNNNHHFPSMHEDVARILVERDIAGVGIDTFSLDTGIQGYPVHNIILGADKYLVENVANAKNLPPTGARIFVLPIKIKDGTEAPIRLIALI